MRRAGGLVVLAAVAAGCSTGSIDDLPTAAGGSTSTLIATVQAVPRAAVPVPADGSVVPSPPPAGGWSVQAVPGAPRPTRGNYAVHDPQPTPGPPRPVPIQVPSGPLEAFRWLEYRCSADASLINRGRDGPYPHVESDRFSGAVLVRELSPRQALIQDGRGTRLVFDGWGTADRLLPESGRLGDPMPEPYRSSCPSVVASG